ncbi:MAG: hypothetical protein Q8P41_20970 [Pseudomonadota bacterium]|nr:hypothetical protein [Pseudomonadota bacterium]
MTKYSLLIGLVALFGCTSTGKDTGETAAPADTDTDTDVDVDWELVTFSGSCADGVCIYSMTTSRAAGLLELWIAETADPSDARWTETHDAFELKTSNADGSEVYELRLDWVTDYTLQVANESTLLNEDVLGATWADRLTWSFEAESADGTEYDCAVTGENPGYYSERCTNIVTE